VSKIAFAFIWVQFISFQAPHLFYLSFPAPPSSVFERAVFISSSLAAAYNFIRFGLFLITA
jgi:hypothetical protein